MPYRSTVSEPGSGLSPAPSALVPLELVLGDELERGARRLAARSRAISAARAGSSDAGEEELQQALVAHLEDLGGSREPLLQLPASPSAVSL